MSKKLEDLYFKWLLKHVCYENEESDYSLILGLLYEKEFRWTIIYDENLAIWALELRKEFYKSSKTVAKLVDLNGEIDKNCSILEMMVCLAKLCEDRIMTNWVENNTYIWFWDMIDNLGLKNYDDISFDFEEVDEILERFLDRNYKKNGEGGLFTIQNPCKNMTKIDIWMQMNLWLVENFE